MTTEQDKLLPVLKAVFAQVKAHFIEREEPQEQWQMPPVHYNGRQKLIDDCDGFCLACRVLLRKQHIPNRLVYCEIDGRGHLVVEVEGWILDNRQRSVVANTLLNHYRWLRISGYNPGEPWREIIS